jgi:hypothetical protein
MSFLVQTASEGAAGVLIAGCLERLLGGAEKEGLTESYLKSTFALFVTGFVGYTLFKNTSNDMIQPGIVYAYAAFTAQKTLSDRLASQAGSLKHAF